MNDILLSVFRRLHHLAFDFLPVCFNSVVLALSFRVFVFGLSLWPLLCAHLVLAVRVWSADDDEENVLSVGLAGYELLIECGKQSERRRGVGPP